MEIKLLVTLQVDCDAITIPTEKIKKTATQAIYHALRVAEDNGFEHRLADEVSIGLVDVEPIEGKEGA